MESNNTEGVVTTPPASAAEESQLDKFYPTKARLTRAAAGEIRDVIAVERRLRELLSLAVYGEEASEDKLVRLVGQLRRQVPLMSKLDPSIKQIIKEVRAWFSSVGRDTDLASDDPAMWITNRDGSPRWTEAQGDEPKSADMICGSPPCDFQPRRRVSRRAPRQPLLKYSPCAPS